MTSRENQETVMLRLTSMNFKASFLSFCNILSVNIRYRDINLGKNCFQRIINCLLFHFNMQFHFPLLLFKSKRMQNQF